MADYDKSLPGLYRERNISFGCPLKLRLASARDREPQFDLSPYINVLGIHTSHPERLWPALWDSKLLISVGLFVYQSIHRVFSPTKNQKGNTDCYNQEMKFKTLTCLLAKPVHKKTVGPMDHCNSPCHYADYSKRG